MGDIEIYYNRDEKTPACYGKETIFLDKEHIDALLSGAKLYFTINDDEYAVEIMRRFKNEQN